MTTVVFFFWKGNVCWWIGCLLLYIYIHIDIDVYKEREKKREDVAEDLAVCGGDYPVHT